VKTDADRVNGTAAGDLVSLGELYTRYKSELYCYARALLRDQALAEDVVHDTFVQLSVAGHTIHSPDAVRKWLYVVVRRLSLNVLHRSRRCEPIDDSEPSKDPSPFEDADQSSIAEMLQRAIAQLPAGFREVIFLREYRQLSYQEICDVTGDTLPAIKSRLHDARKALAGVLAPYLH
jgi:RNA polymerase sigma-70 factor, ECF subfamily